MYTRVQIRNTVFLYAKTIVESDLNASNYEQSKLVVFHSPINEDQNYQMIHLETSASPLNLYYDDDKNLFITDYDDEKRVLESPIKVISIEEEIVKIFVRDYLLEGKTNCIHSSLLKESFYSNRRFEYHGPSRKRSKYTENRLNSISELSQEYGVFTDSMNSGLSMSVLSIIESSQQSASLEIIDDISNESQDVRKTTPIQKSRIDELTQRRIEIEWAKEKLKELLDKYRFPSKDTLVSPEILSTCKNFQMTDSLIVNMVSELKNTLALGESDPIVVTKSGSIMRVLSGSRRVHAFKSVGLNQIKVCSIDPDKEYEFKLYHFYSTSSKSRLEPSVFQFIDYFRALFSYLNLSTESLQQWTTQELKNAFSICLHANVKHFLLLEVSIFPELADAVYKTEPFRTHMSPQLASEVLKRYKSNPLKTLDTITGSVKDAKEITIRKILSTIPPDPQHLLLRKGLPLTNVNHLMSLYGTNSQFPSFVKGLDLRSNAKTLRVESIVKRFEVFEKNSNRLSTKSAPSKLNIIVSPDSNDCDILLTDRADNLNDFVKEKDNAVVLVMGQEVEHGSAHTLVVPNKCGVQDQYGVLHNHCTLSIYCKENGSVLSGRALSDVFSLHGTTRKTIMMDTDFHCFLKNRVCIRAEVFDMSLRKIGGCLLKSSELISVASDECRLEWLDSV